MFATRFMGVTAVVFSAVFVFTRGVANAGTDSAATKAAVPDPASGSSVVPGQLAPDFKLRSESGKEISPRDYLGHWVVLYFYPKDFSKGCTIEAHNFQRDSAQYAKAGAVILGVSVDSVDSHKGFCAKEGLSFKLLADTAANVSVLYGSVMHYNGRTLSARNTFIIDPAGKVVRIFIGVKPAEHSGEVLAALGDLQKK